MESRRHLGEGRDVPRRLIATQDRHRAPLHGHLPQPGSQHNLGRPFGAGDVRDAYAGAPAVVRASAAADLGAISPQAAAEAAVPLTEDLDSGTLKTQIAAARSLSRLDEASRARAIDHLDSLTTSRPTTPTRSLRWIHHVRWGINRLTEPEPD
ncbi:hypothetical protein ACTMTJ_42495 [Phytohabitans sp. LJ34]|uniref:hypothetical protein n=1 Tax=Phytohabitans sp. LJ34 TaxID=3452217 RepID=UPI003F8C54DB